MIMPSLGLQSIRVNDRIEMSHLNICAGGLETKGQGLAGFEVGSECI